MWRCQHWDPPVPLTALACPLATLQFLTHATIPETSLLLPGNTKSRPPARRPAARSCLIKCKCDVSDMKIQQLKPHPLTGSWTLKVFESYSDGGSPCTFGFEPCLGWRFGTLTFFCSGDTWRACWSGAPSTAAEAGGGGERRKRPVKQTAATTRYHHLETYSYQHQTPNDVLIQYYWFKSKDAPISLLSNNKMN